MQTPDKRTPIAEDNADLAVSATGADDVVECASPPCLINEVDPAYMGLLPAPAATSTIRSTAEGDGSPADIQTACPFERSNE